MSASPQFLDSTGLLYQLNKKKSIGNLFHLQNLSLHDMAAEFPSLKLDSVML